MATEQPGYCITEWTPEERTKIFPNLKHLSTGKVREIFEVDEYTLLFVASDRISSFDVVMTNGIPGKGKVLTQLTGFWLRNLKDVEYEWPAGSGEMHPIPNHCITDNVDEMEFLNADQKDLLRGRCMHVRKCNMLPIESIVRGYITGSGWKDYQKTGMVCGHKLPEGMVHGQMIETPIYTPSTKADYGEHDENITREEAAAKVDEQFEKFYFIKDVAGRTEAIAIALYSAARELSKKLGIILADTKFEFGVNPLTREITLGDEVLTPDSSRYWPADEYEAGKPKMPSYDKQFVRNWLIDNGHKGKKVEIPNTTEEPIVDKTIEKYLQLQKILEDSE